MVAQGERLTEKEVNSKLTRIRVVDGLRTMPTAWPPLELVRWLLVENAATSAHDAGEEEEGSAL